MLTPLTTLTAYRADLDRIPDGQRFSAHDGAWVAISRTVEQFVECDAVERPALAGTLGKGLEFIVEGSASPARHGKSVASLARALQTSRDSSDFIHVFDGVMRVAEDIEGAGALQLAYTTLAHLRASRLTTDVTRLGRALTTQARIAREMGDLDSAAELFGEASRTAATHGDRLLACLVAHGQGGLALARGNLPAARLHYEQALAHAKAVKSTELQGRVHRGLLIAAAKEGDFDAALRHGWAAFERSSGEKNSQAELIGNLAGLCRECGYYDASLAGYSLAVLWADMDRVRLPALGGAALAAAHIGDAALVRTLGPRIEDVAAASNAPFESAQLLLDLARAYEITGDGRARSAAARVEAISASHHFFELEHLARELQDRARPDPIATTPRELSRAAVRVLGSVTALAHEASSLSALAGTTG
jgi:tetratricopeptide (TPR) repeat protein